MSQSFLFKQSKVGLGQKTEVSVIFHFICKAESTEQRQGKI